MTDIRINLNQIETDDINTSVFASKSEVNLVQDNVQSLDNNVWVNANDFTTYSTVTANTYNTYTDLSANDYSTYNTLSSLIDTVQDNVSSQSSNTSIVAGGTDLSNTTVFIEAGDGVLLSSNTTSKTVTIATSMSNVTSQEFTLDGSANSFTLAKSAANTHMILVFYNGIAQKPTSYTISGTTLTLSNTRPIAASSDLEVRYFDFFDLPGATSSSSGSYSFQGENFGYASGGRDPTTNSIEKYSFLSDANSSDVGDLTQGRYGPGGQSSDTSGYTSGGSTPTSVNTIDKFPFSSDTNASDVGDLTQARGRGIAGQSSAENGYSSAGFVGSYVDTIDKFPFSSDTNATDVGELTRTTSTVHGGQSSTTHGYTSGGGTNIIDKFPFSSDTSATDVGDLIAAVSGETGQNSDVLGYASGGILPSNPGVGIIQKFPFSSDSNATEVGNLATTTQQAAGASSTNFGYAAGGQPGSNGSNRVEKFPFASDTNAASIGTLIVSRRVAAGQQY